MVPNRSSAGIRQPAEHPRSAHVAPPLRGELEERPLSPARSRQLQRHLRQRHPVRGARAGTRRPHPRRRFGADVPDRGAAAARLRGPMLPARSTTALRRVGEALRAEVDAARFRTPPATPRGSPGRPCRAAGARHGGRQPRHAPGLRPHPQAGAVGLHRADQRRNRNRQGAGRARHSPEQPPGAASVRRHQLRGADRVAARKRAVRPRAGRVHRRAFAQKKGRLEIADGGTIFLDEIGELRARSSPSCLRALQHHEFERVGGTRTIKVDVRVIAATNRDLAAEVAAGRFRQDLWYRLNVVNVTMPPLRERREDIPGLAAHFAAKYARGRACRALSRCAAGADGA